MKPAVWCAVAFVVLALVVLALGWMGVLDLSWIGAAPRERVQFRALEPQAVERSERAVASAEPAATDLAHGALIGRVIDQDGAPLARAEVSIVALGGESSSSGGMRLVRESTLGTGSIVTSEDGSFRSNGLPAGDVLVRVVRDGGLHAGMSGRVEIRAGQESHDLVVVAARVPEDHIITGVVLDPSGQPVPRAYVTFRHGSFLRSVTESRLADDTGRFFIVTSSRASHDLTAVDLAREHAEAHAEAVEPGTRELVLRLVE